MLVYRGEKDVFVNVSALEMCLDFQKALERLKRCICDSMIFTFSTDALIHGNLQ